MIGALSPKRHLQQSAPKIAHHLTLIQQRLSVHFIELLIWVHAFGTNLNAPISDELSSLLLCCSRWCAWSSVKAYTVQVASVECFLVKLCNLYYFAIYDWFTFLEGLVYLRCFVGWSLHQPQFWVQLQNCYSLPDSNLRRSWRLLLPWLPYHPWNTSISTLVSIWFGTISSKLCGWYGIQKCPLKLFELLWSMNFVVLLVRPLPSLSSFCSLITQMPPLLLTFYCGHVLCDMV